MAARRRGRSGGASRRTRPAASAPPGDGQDQAQHALDERLSHPETGPVLTGGDVDADWQRAWSAGEEAVGGSAPTPDQDIVDEIGRAWGVEQRPTAPVRTSGEILEERDARRWGREAAEAARASTGRAAVPRRRTS